MSPGKPKLTAAQTREARDLAKHAGHRVIQAMIDAVRLVSDDRQKAHIALTALASMVGAVAGSIDRAEGRTTAPGTISPEAHRLILSVFVDLSPAGRALLANPEGGEDA